MQTFKIKGAQGNIDLTRIDEIPEGAVEVAPENGQLILSHSESGGHHVMDPETTTMCRLPDSVYDAFLTVKEPTELKHLREFDKHESILVPTGKYLVESYREYTPEGYRLQAD